MKRILSFILAFITLITLSPTNDVKAAGGAIPKDAKEFNGNYYYVYKDYMTWEAAKETCESLGGHLATITSASEQNFVSKLTDYGNDYWLGGYRDSNEWKWITGETMKYTELGYEYDDTSWNYLKYNGSDGTWGNYRNSSSMTHYYICEWEAEDVDTRLPVKAVISSVKKASSTSVTITWKRVRDAAGYSVYMKTGTKGTYKKIADIKEGDITTYVQTDLTKGKTYYYRVRAFKTVYNEKSYGELSSSKKINLK